MEYAPRGYRKWQRAENKCGSTLEESTMNVMSKRLAGLSAAAAISVAGLGAAGSVAAQPVTQNGLVNVNLTDVDVLVPVSVAANVCDLNVAVLVGVLNDLGGTDCDASATSNAMVEPDPDSSGPVRQNGLVNLNITDLNIQVPISVAANICGVNVGVLVGELRDFGATDCVAEGDSGVSTPG